MPKTSATPPDKRFAYLGLRTRTPPIANSCEGSDMATNPSLTEEPNAQKTAAPSCFLPRTKSGMRTLCGVKSILTVKVNFMNVSNIYRAKEWFEVLPHSPVAWATSSSSTCSALIAEACKSMTAHAAAAKLPNDHADERFRKLYRRSCNTRHRSRRLS
jgi:hypothetical protein